MKKSQNKSKKKELDPDEILKDFDRLINFANHIDTLDLNTANIDKLGKTALSFEKEMRKKSTGFYNPKNIKKGLDTRE